MGTAILAGGSGAVLWMWLTGVFGMATKYSETFAAVKYRVTDHNGNMLGGAMYAWRRAFEKDGKTPWWGLLCRGVRPVRRRRLVRHRLGRAVQRHDWIITSNAPGVPTWGIGLAIVIMVSIVIFGGIKIISKVCEKLVPFMAIAYAWGCIVIIGMNWEYAYSPSASSSSARSRRRRRSAARWPGADDGAGSLAARAACSNEFQPGLGAHRGLGPTAQPGALYLSCP